jgi:hypothetical protein
MIVALALRYNLSDVNQRYSVKAATFLASWMIRAAIRMIEKQRLTVPPTVILF